MKMVASETAEPRSSVNNFVPVDVLDNYLEKKSNSPATIKMYLKPNIYLELTTDMNSKILNKIFTALEVL